MNSPKFRLALGVALVLIMAALFLGQQSYPVQTEVKDGVKTITSPDFPRDGRYKAKFNEEMSCGGKGGPEAGLLNRPLELDVDDRGNVYVMDMGDVNIKAYDGQGRFLRTIGRQGQGPGEFGGLAFFNLISGGRLCVLDTMQHRVIVLTTEGRYVSGFPLEGYSRSLAADGNDNLYLVKWGALKEIEQLSTEFREVPYITSIFRTDATGKTLVHLSDFLGESLVMKAMGAGGVVSVGGLFTIVWTVTRGGKLYGGFNGEYSLGAYDANGKIEFSFGRKYSPVKNKRYGGKVGQKETMPPFGAIAIDENGNVWVELVQAENAKGALYDVFTPDGIYSKQVAIEQRINQFKNGKIYSIVFSEEGYPSVKRYALELVPSGR